MKINQGTVWFDLSDALLRAGRITGIQRVTYELARRYLEEFPDKTKFFFYDPANMRFLECDLPGLSSPREDDSPSRTPTPHLSNLKQGVRRTVKLLAPPITIKGAVFITQKLKDKQPQPETLSITFDYNDTVVILGGNWDKPHYLSGLNELVRPKSIRLVHLIHDLIPIFDKGHVSGEEHERFPAYMKQVVSSADSLLITSNFVESQVGMFINEQKIETIAKITRMRLGDSLPKVTKPIRPEGLTKDITSYMLTVGTIEVRKNHMLLYYALKLAHQRGIKLPHLVIVGRVGWMSEEVRFMFSHDPDVCNYVTMLNNASDAELSWLYDNCSFTVFPSFSEGWGLPVAESVARGSFCIASTAASISEIAGNKIDYFSPFNPEECLQKMVLYANDSKLLQKRKVALKQYQPWPWDETYKQLKQAL